MATKIDIGGELNPRTVEGIVADASTIIDRTAEKRQDEINSEVSESLEGKQDAIADLETIRSGAASGSTAIQPTQIEDVVRHVDTGALEPLLDPSDYATTAQLNQLGQKVDGNSFSQTNLSSVAGRWVNNNGVVGTGTSSTLFRFNPIMVSGKETITYTTNLASLVGLSLIVADTSENVLLSSSSESKTITLPSSAKKLYFTSTKAAFSCSIKGIIENISEMDEAINESNTSIKKNEYSIYGFAASEQDNPGISNSAWVNNNGVISFGSSSYGLKRAPAIKVFGGCKFSLATSTSSSAALSAFICDSDGNVLSSVPKMTAGALYNGICPENSSFIYINYYATYNFSIIGLQTSVEGLQTSVEGLQTSVGGKAYNSSWEHTSGRWINNNGVIGTSASSSLYRFNPISISPGQKFIYTGNLASLNPPLLIITDADDNVLDIPASIIGGTMIAPANAAKLYFSSTLAAFSCKVEGVYGSMTQPMELPIYAPSPQLPADGTTDADFNAETLTPSELYASFDALMETLPSPNGSAYDAPKYMTKYSVVERDASNTYDLFAYVLANRNRFGWKAANALYAYKNGDTIVYIDSVSPVVGATIYSDSARTDSGKTISSYDSTNQQFTASDNVVYTKSVDDNVAADIIYTKSAMALTPANLPAFDSNDNALGTATAVNVTTLSLNGKSYIRCTDFDRDINSKGTICLWANEHGPQSDPAEPAIILYRMAKDLCGGCRNNPFLMYLKKNYKIVMIPCGNPYGLQNHTRNNSNGVNINRNYNTPGWSSQSDSDNGAYAGSEAETQYIMNVCSASCADIAIDVHCLGYTGQSNDGLTHYAGHIQNNHWFGKRFLDRLVDTMKGLSFACTSYGDATPNSAASGDDWLYYMGKAGGLIEMNPGPNAASFDGKQHSAHYLEANYTLLLASIRMWMQQAFPDLSLAGLGII